MIAELTAVGFDLIESADQDLERLQHALVAALVGMHGRERSEPGPGLAHAGILPATTNWFGALPAAWLEVIAGPEESFEARRTRPWALS